MKLLPKGCVIRGSQVLAIKSDGGAKKTAVTAVKVKTACGQDVWLRLPQFIQDKSFDYVFGADGVHSLLAKWLNPEMVHNSGEATNTVVTCLKNEGLTQQLSLKGRGKVK